MARSDKPFEGIGGGGGVSSTAAKDILKKAISAALAKRAKSVTSAEGEKALIKEILNNKQVEKTNLTQKDIAQGLYNFYKRNPKIDTSVKTSKAAPDVIKAAKDRRIAKAIERKENIKAGISPSKVKPPKKSAASEVTERQKAMAKAALKRERKKTAEAKKAETRAAKKEVVKVNIKDKVQGKNGSIKVTKPTGKAAEAEKKSLKEGMRQAFQNDNKSTPTIESRMSKASDESVALADEMSNISRAIASLSKEEKIAFRLAEQRANAKFKPDMPKPKKIQSVDDRLAAAQKKLTPAQLKKIKAIVAETRRRAGA
jgi:hypothetical protein